MPCHLADFFLNHVPKIDFDTVKFFCRIPGVPKLAGSLSRNDDVMITFYWIEVLTNLIGNWK